MENLFVQDEKKEIADAMNKGGLPLKCPSCRRSNATVLEAARKIPVGNRVGFLLFGLLMLVAFIFMEKPDAWSPLVYAIVKLIALFSSIMLIWNGAFGLPLPIIGNLIVILFGQPYEIQSKCSDCDHQWSRVIYW